MVPSGSGRAQSGSLCRRMASNRHGWPALVTPISCCPSARPQPPTAGIQTAVSPQPVQTTESPHNRYADYRVSPQPVYRLQSLPTAGTVSSELVCKYVPQPVPTVQSWYHSRYGEFRAGMYVPQPVPRVQSWYGGTVPPRTRDSPPPVSSVGRRTASYPSRCRKLP